MDGNRNSHKRSDQVITIPGAVPAIIDHDTWDRVQVQIRHDRKRGGSYHVKEALEIMTLEVLREQLNGCIPDLVEKINASMLALAEQQTTEIAALDSMRPK